jgi:hypothetical protein
MGDLAARYPVAAWKVYTHAGGPGWYLDDSRAQALEHRERLDPRVHAGHDRHAGELHDAQNQIAEDCPILPLYQLPKIYAYSSNLQGPQVNPSLAGPYWNVGDWKVT